MTNKIITFEIGFYRFLLWFAQFELVIALSTGRNPENVMAIRDDVSRLAQWVDILEIQK